MEVVDFKIEHFDRMDIEERGMLSRTNRSAYEAYSKSGPCFTLLGDIPIFSAGIVIMWKGCGNVWMLMSTHIKEYREDVFKYTTLMFDKYFKEYDFHRVQALVKTDDVKANKFAVHSKLEFEGVMRNYWIDKSDYNLYARISNG